MRRRERSSDVRALRSPSSVIGVGVARRTGSRERRLALRELAQHVGDHRQAGRVAVLVLQVGEVRRDEVQALGEPHGDEPGDARIAREQRVAIGGVAQRRSARRFDGRAVDRVEQHRDLADQRARTGDRVDDDRALPHLQRTGDEHPEAASDAALVNDDLARGERDLGQVGRKRQHVGHRLHPMRHGARARFVPRRSVAFRDLPQRAMGPPAPHRRGAPLCGWRSAGGLAALREGVEAERHPRFAAARVVLATPERAAAFARRPLDELDAAARAGRPPPVAVEGDGQERLLLLRVARGDQAKQPVDVVQADAVAGGELARVGAEVGGRHELATRDAVLRHDAAQLAHFLDADLPAHPLLALDDRDRRIAIGVVLAIEPDVDAAVGAVRLRARLEPGLREQRLDDGLEATPLDQLEDLA